MKRKAIVVWFFGMTLLLVACIATPKQTLETVKSEETIPLGENRQSNPYWIFDGYIT